MTDETSFATPQAPATLYVGDLEPSVTEAILFEVFNQVGPVASIRVCRDAVTRRSLGYGYVNYLNMIDAERALESLNYQPIRGVPLRIMWSNRDPSLRKAGNANIFIKNLDPSIDNKTLHDTFVTFGNILSCKVAMDGDKSRGYGYIHYETRDMAQNAIDNVNGMLMNDRQVYVGFHVSKKERESKVAEQRSKFTNIYVKNLDSKVTQEEFEEMFVKFGPVVSASLSVDEQGASKEFGFVNYVNHADAQKAVDEMNEKVINEKPIYVGRAQKKNEREEELRKQYEKIREEKLSKYQGVNLYVKNLDDSVDDDKLREDFSPFGVITSAKVMFDEKTGTSKCFGFVCFTTPDEATKAVTEMNGRIMNNKPIYVALAQRKETRRAQLAVQIQQRNIRMQPMVPGPQYPGQMFYPPQRGGFFPGQQQMLPRPGAFPGRPLPGQQFQQMPGQQFPMVPVRGQRPPNQRQQPMPTRGPRPGGFKYANAPRQTRHIQAADLASLPPDDQKRFLGESLFPQVSIHAPGQPGKITGMLLEMDNSELLHLLESPEALKSRVEEAVNFLERSKQDE
jgi:polyadenylate-binding protein